MDDARVPVDSHVAVLAYAAMNNEFTVVLSGVDHLRRAHDSEILHEVRVANRRLRAALLVFDDVLPKRAASLRVRLGAFGKGLGAMRDLDVLLERIAAGVASGDSGAFGTAGGSAAGATGGAVSVLRVLERRRASAWSSVRRSLESVKTQRLLAATAQFLAAGAPQRARTVTIAAMAKGALEQAHDRVRTLGDAVIPLRENAPDAALHGLRVRTKHLRFTAELFEPAFGPAAHAFARRAIDVQDVLGAFRDATQAARTLRDIAGALPPLAAFEAGRVAQGCLDDARRACKDLPAAYKKLSGGRWRKLINVAQDAAMTQ
ncbi:MAG: hypothetical protein NVSMB57_12780 [Actinomycetota bacterium]